MAWLFPFPLQRQLNLCSLSLNCHGKQWPQCADSCVWECFPIFISSGKLWGLCLHKCVLFEKKTTPLFVQNCAIASVSSLKLLRNRLFHLSFWFVVVKVSRVHMHSLPFLYTGQKQARSVRVRKQRSTSVWSAITYLLFLLCSGRGT